MMFTWATVSSGTVSSSVSVTAVCTPQIFGGPDDTSPRLTKLCHTQTTAQHVTSTGNHMFVRFKTNGTQSGRGFHASYKTISGGE